LLSVSSFEDDGYVVTFQNGRVLVYARESTPGTKIVLGIYRERLLRFNIRFCIKFNVIFNINVKSIVRGQKLRDSSQYTGENDSIIKPYLKFVNMICICVNLLKSIRRLVSNHCKL
jgi:hypothetical protein